MSPPYSLTGTCTDSIISGTNSQTVNIGGSVSNSGNCSGGAFTIATDYSGQSDGSISVTADISDVAGNAATQVSASLTKDATAPTVTITAQSVCDVTPDLSGTINDNSATINVNIDGSDYTGTNNGDGTEPRYPVIAADNAGIPNGTYNVTVTGTDSNSNAATDGHE